MDYQRAALLNYQGLSIPRPLQGLGWPLVEYPLASVVEEVAYQASPSAAVPSADP
jgi:hypothetical protein